MLEEIRDCPICGSDKNEKELICKDYSISREEFHIVRCTNCQFIFTTPRPSENYIGKYYQSDAYISHQDNNKGLLNNVYYLIKQKNLKNKLNLINELYQRGQILDIGCGTGSFLHICKEDGWNIRGVEPDENARKKAISKTQSQISADLISIEGEKSFDIITMWHVLEHIHKLNETIEKIYTLLKESGKLVIAVPNVESYDAKVFKQYWAAYDIPRHLYHFSKETLQKLMQKHGLKLEKVLPMPYDAYYISLLSLKNKFNKMDYLNAFAIGFKSNLRAKSTTNHSSLTYIFSK